ncbi:MAG: acyl-CoA dehydrogenase [Candidatus Eisenbacteria bacterium]|uniref:Acyl-CoA dehydrogenase n=1 Tax=Eiseniibacteriota bacterium TaxID=2212470 RepID=A0A849SQ83_UNCEI|nr:acyl-CoA dehydrogenase [Candidatus Eisenbacteria bacterium]
MDFGLTPEQHELVAATLAFAREELDRDVATLDSEDRFDRDAWMKCAAFGIQGLPIPTEYGGQGRDLLSTILAMEALGRGSRDNGLAFSLNAQMWACQMPILAYGSEAQKREWLPKLVSGAAIGAHAITEPGAGSDVFSLTARAVRVGTAGAADAGYRLSGAKTFSTNAPLADVAIAFAYLEREGKSKALTAFVVPRDTPGVSFGNPIHKMGLRTSPMGEVIFADAFVPETARLGPEGGGMAVFNSAMEWERACIFAAHVGAMERLLDDSIRYARQRRQFGQPIAKFESVANRIADMKVALEAARLLIYRVGWMHGQGKSTAMESAIAKLFVSEAHVRAALDALQLHGGYGYMREYPIEREVRDALSGTLYSGTSEMQRKIIARLLGL